jgi:light-regulated signal transduction histidine kinase (bacteriophytochrome)
MSTLRTQMMAGSPKDVPFFVWAISHDLKEPLRTILGCADLLSEGRGISGDDADRLLKFVSEAAKRMQKLIDDALSFALVDGAEKGKSRVDLGEALQFALSNLREAVGQAGAVVTSDALPTISANFGALAQVFQNLIANAIKFRSEREPRIHVGCTRSGAEWIIAVADNGIGIKAQYREQIFAPLKRLHGKGQYPGSGLGLAICSRIIESHGGRIWVESIPGAGSTFYFTFPASAKLSMYTHHVSSIRTRTS